MAEQIEASTKPSGRLEPLGSGPRTRTVRTEDGMRMIE